MKRKRHTTDEIIRKLREADQMAAGGDTVPQICQKLEVSVQTLGRLREQCRGIGDVEIV
jgi:putative transposase